MRINEVERRVGVSKKNIRFYEEEGLLKPGRNAENGYREYSEADVEQLLKIRLLRQLSVPLEEIRRLQTGCPAVQICEACGKAGDISLDMACVLNLLDGVDHDLADRHKPVGVPSLGDLKDPLLRVVHDHFQIVFLRVTRSRYFLIGADHSAQQRFF